MCNRFRLARPEVLEEHFQAWDDIEHLPRFNLARVPHPSRFSKGGCRRRQSGFPLSKTSEYVRDLIRRDKEKDKERRLGNLEQGLIAAAKGPKIELPIAEIRKKGLIVALRERARQR